MDLKQMVIQYNIEIKNSLQIMYDALNQGQKNKILKNEKVKSLLVKYKIVQGE